MAQEDPCPSGLSEEVQIFLRDIIAKEVEIYTHQHPSYAPYEDDLVGEIFITIAQRLRSKGFPQSRTYLKAAAHNELMHHIRDINSDTRTSTLRMLGRGDCEYFHPRMNETSDPYGSPTHQDYSELPDKETRSPGIIVAQKEEVQILLAEIQKVDLVLRVLIRDRTEGIPIRNTARKLGISKSRACRLILDFQNKLTDLLR